MEGAMIEKNNKNYKKYKKQTQLVRGGLTRSQYGETSESIFMNSGYVFTSAEEAKARFAGELDGYLYSRYGNPTVKMFEERMALNEESEACFATASGMSAVFASLMSFLKSGDHIVSSCALFGSCYHILDQILPRYGIITHLINGTDLSQWEKHITNKTKCIFLESPSNPTMEIIDIKSVANIAHQHNALVIVDNILASPVLQKPMEFGADIVVYSGTKHIDGQGRSIGGAILSSKHHYEEYLKPFIRHTGPTLSPFNAWVLLKGLETLRHRMDQHCHNAFKVANYLSQHPKIEKTIYPSLKNHPQFALAKKQMLQGGSIVTFIIKGNSAFKFMNALNLFDISNNFGDTKSFATHPATTTHRIIGEEGRKKLNISDNMIRLSIGLEDVDDLIEDIESALKTT
jgi:O-succinylhomoserine sulfhydrylase